MTKHHRSLPDLFSVTAVAVLLLAAMATKGFA
jgi:hypothetical protein